MKATLILVVQSQVRKDVNALISAVAREDVRVELVQKEDGYYLDTNVYELIEGFKNRMIDSDVLGKAFEPEERFENPDRTAIRFDSDYFWNASWCRCHSRTFADAKESVKKAVLIEICQIDILINS